MNRVQLEFSASYITQHPISQEDIDFLVKDTKELIDMENQAIARGEDPHELKFDQSRLFRPLPHLTKKDGQSKGGDFKLADKIKDLGIGRESKENKLATVVTDVWQKNRKGGLPEAVVALSKAQQALKKTDKQQGSKSCIVL